ncbi:MAG: ATP-binding protein [Treponema sp.]|nr:ATP-binding protein [Treponema sp.]
MFVGRHRELEELEKYYREGTFHFAVFYGRRRVGKTTLINRFRENKTSVYFAAAETTAKENLELLSARILSVLVPEAPGNPFVLFNEAFDYCFRAALKKQVVLIIDEYPYLAESERSVSSLLQAAIDKYKEKTRLFLILCGSSMSFMENQVLGYKSPLYGRRTCQFKIQPFSYYDSAEMLPAFSGEDKITLYGMCGGIPDYLSRINNGLSVRQNAENLFFNPAGRLFEEPTNLLKQELRTPQTYNAIITAIAWGASKLNEIATKAGIETSQCSNMLATLIGLGIVKKEYPLAPVQGSVPVRKTIYRLEDFMFRFWYRFVLPDLSRISMGYGKMVCAEIFGKAASGGKTETGKIETYTGPVFEECAAQFLWRELGRGRYNFKTLGRWWGPNPKEKREEEIDLIAFDDANNALLGECKWRNSRTGNDTLDDLIRKSELLPDYAARRYILFSKSEFTAELRRTAAARKDTILVRAAEMF